MKNSGLEPTFGCDTDSGIGSMDTTKNVNSTIPQEPVINIPRAQTPTVFNAKSLNRSRSEKRIPNRLDVKHAETLAKIQIMKRTKYLQETNMIQIGTRNQNTSMRRAASTSHISYNSKRETPRFMADKMSNNEAWRKEQLNEQIQISGATFKPKVFF